MYIVDNKSKESYCLVCANEVSTKQILNLINSQLKLISFFFDD